MSYNPMMNSPFLLENQTEYKKWRDNKLAQYPASKNKILVKLNNSNLNNNSINLLRDSINKYNFGIYEFNSKLTNEYLKKFCSKLKLLQSVSNLLADENDISNITNQNTERKQSSGIEYIPYTNKQLNWHTDGYYYPIDSAVKSFLLHCEHPAKIGGENILLDHEIMYIFLRDHNPDYIKILMQNDIMEIPGNKNIKGSSSIKGPVFYIDEKNFLNMRFTSRQQNIIWQKSDMIKKIKDYIFSFIAEDNYYTFNILLRENQGYIANNVLHKRKEYVDGDKKRLLKRLRFSERVE
ncbi:MAG: TauD/TfdA family dioxygenase [Gammaproteobacteria bacterium]|nr:TauD/TfdA family dioxygenase [Gammaproteobacteria bacterium]